MIDTFLMIYIIFCRLLELFLSKKNTQKLLEEGAVEFYKTHYIFIVLFHVFFTAFFLYKSFFNNTINLEYLYLFIVVQFLRYKIIYDLGKFWTTRIIVIHKPLVKTFLFRYLRHPNYIIVFFEVLLVCLFFDDFISVVLFSSVNFVLICIRIFYEEKANKFRQKF
tara:strand:+ start:2169 stop:2663 length:495 start_codon:yes stop_codon:yes gene_type:complete